MKSMNALLFASLLVTSGCAHQGYRSSSVATQAPEFVEAPVQPCLPSEDPFECDRRAILAMRGEFQVRFAFDETAVLASGYERQPAQRSGAHEAVILVEDSGTRIDLQHVLVVGDGHVVKHWRQTWVYEANPVWVFAGDQRFRIHGRDAEDVGGTWTQYVHEVSDAPRYTGSGRWVHESGVSTWTSEPGWRPLPRREYTKRSDYQVLQAVNRHSITPGGWTHEQDNAKVQIDEQGTERVLVREVGFNEYRRIRGHDFSPVYAYWKDTAGFWAMVRERWEAELSSTSELRLNYPVADENFIHTLFEAAQAYGRQPDTESAARIIDSVFSSSVRRVDDARVSRAVCEH